MDLKYLTQDYRLLQSKLKEAQGLGFSGSLPEWTDDEAQNQLLASQYDVSSLQDFYANTGGISSEMTAIYNEIQKYKDDLYTYEQLMNMYRSYRAQKFSPNAFQDVAEFFGDNSARTNFENQRIAGLRSEMQKILESQHTEDVTDPVIQAQKQRDAGLNPDLTGGISAQQAGSIDQSEQAPALINEGQQVFTQVVQDVMNVVTTGMSFAQNLQALQAGDFQIMSHEFDIYDKAMKGITKQLTYDLDERTLRIISDPYQLDKDGNRVYSEDEVNEAFTWYEESFWNTFDHNPFMSNRTKRKLKHMGSNNPKSSFTRTQMFNYLRDIYKGKQEAVSTMGNPFNNKGFEECIDIFSQYIQKTQVRIQELNAQFETDRLSYTEDKKSLGQLAGESDAKAFSADSYIKEYNKEVEEMWTNIMDALKKKDTWWSHLLRFLVPIARTSLTNLALPSVSHTTSSDNFGKTTSNSSWSF